MLQTHFHYPTSPARTAARRFAAPTLADLPALILTVFCALLLNGCTPPGPAALLEGKRLLEKGDPRAAIQPLRDAVDLMRTNGLAWSYLGLAYQQSGNLSNAVTCYSWALRQDRDLIEVRYNLGMAWLDLGRADSAIPEFNAFTLRKPKEIRGWIALGQAQLRTKDLAGALRSHAEALKLENTNAAALNGMGLTLAQRGRMREALPYFSAAVQQQPTLGAALRNLATAQQSLKDPAGALQTWKKYAALTPPPPELATVEAVIRQLESPPPARTNVLTGVAPASTNLTLAPTQAVAVRPVATNAPKPPATNPMPVVRQPPASNVVTVTPKPPTPQTNALPQPPTNAPLQVVQLTNQQPLPTARDIAALRTNPPAPITPTPMPTPAPVVTIPPTNPAPAEATPAAEPEKRGFFAKINPLNLFKKKPKESPRVTALPQGTQGQTNSTPALQPTNSASSATSTREPATNTASPPRRAPGEPPQLAWPRYNFVRPTRPAHGDRIAADSAFRAGLTAQRNGQPREALESYTRATTLDPSLFEAWNNLGLVANELGLAASSLAAYETALTLKPDSADARYNFAIALRDNSYMLDAANEFQQVLTINPADVQANLALGNLYAQRLKDPAKARGYYQRVLELDPNHPQSTTIRLWLRNHGG